MNFWISCGDVILPASPGWWPPAVGWWALGVFILLLMIGIFYALRRINFSLSKDSVTHRVTEIGTLHPQEAVVELSLLMRQVAVSKFPRTQAAGLTGEEWLKFLDETGNTDQFTSGPGSILSSAPYSGNYPDDIAPLIAVCREWVKRVMR